MAGLLPSFSVGLSYRERQLAQIAPSYMNGPAGRHLEVGGDYILNALDSLLVTRSNSRVGSVSMALASATNSSTSTRR